MKQDGTEGRYAIVGWESADQSGDGEDEYHPDQKRAIERANVLKKGGRFRHITIYRWDDAWEPVKEWNQKTGVTEF